ncbi:MAG: hypothetical protein KBD36_00505 [Alphaproteobacteria bacterium]|nr:hypothetical protein [Alphaproteobacteria bacterium]MBP9776317.1 hypothetical protein [Alphaproteobacteria bacterium]
MLKKLGGVILMTSQLTTVAYGDKNHKLLDLEVSAYHSKIWSNIPSSKSTIKQSFGFLSSLEDVNAKYTKPSSFQDFYGEIKSNIRDPKLTRFAQVCKEIYEESIDDTAKVAVYMHLEEVTKKYQRDLRQLAKLEAFKSHQPEENPQNTEAIMNEFLNADKSISTH